MSRHLKFIKSITLIELLVSMVIVSIIILSFYGLETFSRSLVFDSEKKSKVQNQLAYALEHMSKYIQQAVGRKNDPGIRYYPGVGEKTGFEVRVDLRSPQNPADLANTAWVRYYLDGSNLKISCASSGTGVCGALPVNPEVLSDKIIGSFVFDEIMPIGTTDGFYVKIDASAGFADIGLAGRNDTSSSSSLNNPQVEIKTRAISSGSSSN